MPYTSIDKCYQISRYAEYKYGKKLTLTQLKEAILMIVRTENEFAINRYVDMVQKDYGDLAKPQFKQQDGFFIPCPNRPKTPNDLIAKAFKDSEKA